MSRPFNTVVDLYRPWREDILSDDLPATWDIGDPTIAHVEISPGKIILPGGAPGAGKTALLLQWIGGILDTEPEARVMVANVEMSPHQLLNRSLSRISRVPLTAIRKRQVMPDDIGRLGTAMARIESYADRLAFARAPGNLDSIREAASAHGTDILVIDYLQRIDPPGKYGAMRDRINALMSELRRLADGGTALLCAAALTRSRDGNGRASYAGQHLSLASFRESSELEYGCDSAFLLYPTDEDDKKPVRSMLLSHVKNRDGETTDTALVFDRRIQRFEADPFLNVASTSSPQAERVRAGWSQAARNGKHGGPTDERPF